MLARKNCDIFFIVWTKAAHSAYTKCLNVNKHERFFICVCVCQQNDAKVISNHWLNGMSLNSVYTIHWTVTALCHARSLSFLFILFLILSSPKSIARRTKSPFLETQTKTNASYRHFVFTVKWTSHKHKCSLLVSDSALSIQCVSVCGGRTVFRSVCIDWSADLLTVTCILLSMRWTPATN